MHNRNGQQKDAFINGEADRYFQRNKNDASHDDCYLRVFSLCGISPQRVLEIGCGPAHKIQKIYEHYGGNVSVHGIEPSPIAVESAGKAYPGLHLRQGTADCLPYEDGFFDLVIFGTCLYLCDRSLLFTIAAEADRVLSHSGHMVVADFIPPFPYRNSYKHKAGIYSYKMDYSRMFSWNPEYTLAGRFGLEGTRSPSGPPDERWVLSVLAKNKFETNCPLDPFHAP